MTNPNDIIQSKHFDSLAAAFSGAINVLSFAQNSAPVTDATFNNGIVSIGDKTFALTGFRNDLILHDGKFFAADDINHQSPLGNITANFDAGTFQCYSFNFYNLDVLDSALQTGSTVAVNAFDCSLHFAQGGFPSSISVEWHEWVDDPDNGQEYYVVIGGQSDYLQRVSNNAYVYTPAPADIAFDLWSHNYTLKFVGGAVSGRIEEVDGVMETIGSFSSTAPFDFKLFNPDGDEIKLDDINLPRVFDAQGNAKPYANTAIDAVELVITDPSAFLGGTESLDAAIKDNANKIDIYLESSAITGSAKESGKIATKVSLDKNVKEFKKYYFDYSYWYYGQPPKPTFSRVATADAYTFSKDKTTTGFFYKSVSSFRNHLRYRATPYVGDSFSVTGLVGGLSLADNTLYLGNVPVGSLEDRSNFANGYYELNISDISAINTEKIRDGGKIVLSNNGTGSVGARLSFSSDLTNYTKRDGYNSNGTWEELGGGAYKYSSNAMPDYVESPVVVGSGINAVFYATYHAPTASSFTVSGLSAGADSSLGNVSGKTFLVNDYYLLTGTDVEVIDDTDDYKLSLQNNSNYARNVNAESFTHVGGGSYTYNATASTLGFVPDPDGKALRYNSVDMNGKSFTLSGLRTDLGNMTFISTGEFQTQGGEIIGRLLNNTLTLYQNAFYRATITNSTENISLDMP